MTTITIGKELNLSFFGRNGPGRMCGAQVLAYGNVLDICPITSRGKTGRCRISIPAAQVDELIEALRSEVRKLRPSGPDGLARHFGAWGEHPDYPRSDWRYLVSNGDTQRGYWEHVQACIDQTPEDAPDARG